MANEQLELFPAEEELQTETKIQKEEPKVIMDSEWCFQFFDNEPVVFGWQEDEASPFPLQLQVNPFENESLTFTQSGMSFKIFARPISEQTRKQRIEQKIKAKELEDASKNKKIKSKGGNS